MDGIKDEPDPVTNQDSQRGRKNIIFPTNQDIKLHESENAWRPSFKVKHLTGESTALQELTKRIRGILNKLTSQNFQTLVAQVRHELGLDTEAKLNVVVNLIFENALYAPKFSVPFANMCKSLALIRVPQGGSGGMVHFRKLLLTKCLQEFEKDNVELQREERKNAIDAVDAAKCKKLQMEFEERKKKIRMRQLANIRFIGELFKLSMIIEPIMHEYIKKLLSQGDEESLECLCCLLKTIGRKLDKIGSKNPGDLPNPMDQYFGEIQKIVDRKMTSSRIHFMLQDVIDLRIDNWIARRGEKNPKTIDMNYKEAESFVNFAVDKVNSNCDINIDEIRVKLKELLSENGENETIFDWINANVPPYAVSEPVFIRALVQEVHKASIFETHKGKELDQATLKKRLPLLTRFIDYKKHLELQALYAVQHLLNDLKQPKGVLRQIFDVLYDDDVITEDSFKMWEQCKDPSEQEGKDVALMSVRGFFTWLREAESGKDVEDE